MMNDTPILPERPDKPAWTTPLLEHAGTIDDVKGGAVSGLDGNGLPAALS